ncbi:MAG: hypothetical protein M3Z19_14310 [Chloroflexota bacterium]|nr:hypothetical protein [Chloroflexota bacterium]
MAAIAEQAIAQYIGADPHHHGAHYAILREEGIPVWALIGHLIGVDWDVRQAAEDYEIPTAAVEAAVLYYRQHKDALDAVIAPTLAFQRT